jgi:hypothetical protein
VCGSRPQARIRATSTPRRKSPVADLDGLKLYTFPTAGRFLTSSACAGFNIPYEDAEVAVQTGELDGMSWSGITEDYTVGWADVTDYFLTNNISGAWIGSWFANEEKWNALPEHLKQLYMACMEADPHLPQPVVLGRRSQAARHRGQAAAALGSRLRMEAGRRTPPRCSGTRSPRKAKPRQRSSRSSRNTTRSSTPPASLTAKAEWPFLETAASRLAPGGGLPLQRITKFRPAGAAYQDQITWLETLPSMS